MTKDLFKRPCSLKELSQWYLQGSGSFDILFRDFLHEFNYNPAEIKLNEEPLLINKINRTQF
ncbi:MAG: hypothetical protein ACYCSW_05825 [bacterium]